MSLFKPLLWLAILVILLAALITISGNSATRQMEVVSPSGAVSQEQQNGPAYVPPQPPPTAADMIAAQPKTGFQSLVSYTDQGFEPAQLQVHSGDTVRFTNNSHGQLWVAATGSELYPAVQNGCGSSALDSCGPLQPGYYWQFTFTKSGTWTFYNNLNKSKTGTVVVEVE